MAISVISIAAATAVYIAACEISVANASMTPAPEPMNESPVPFSEPLPHFAEEPSTPLEYYDVIKYGADSSGKTESSSVSY